MCKNRLTRAGNAAETETRAGRETALGKAKRFHAEAYGVLLCSYCWPSLGHCFVKRKNFLYYLSQFLQMVHPLVINRIGNGLGYLGYHSPKSGHLTRGEFGARDHGCGWILSG